MNQRANLTLRSLLAIDAIASGAMALLLLATATWLDGQLDLSTTFLRGTGLVLVPWTLYLILVARRPLPASKDVTVVLAGNVAWVIASIGVLFTNAIDPNSFGIAVIVAQAVFVAALTALQAYRAATPQSPIWTRTLA